MCDCPEWVDEHLKVRLLEGFNSKQKSNLLTTFEQLALQIRISAWVVYMWHFGTWFSRHGGVGWVVGLHESSHLRHLFQPMIL